MSSSVTQSSVEQCLRFRFNDNIESMRESLQWQIECSKGLNNKYSVDGFTPFSIEDAERELEYLKEIEVLRNAK